MEVGHRPRVPARCPHSCCRPTAASAPHPSPSAPNPCPSNIGRRIPRRLRGVRHERHNSRTFSSSSKALCQTPLSANDLDLGGDTNSKAGLCPSWFFASEPRPRTCSPKRRMANALHWRRFQGIQTTLSHTAAKPGAQRESRRLVVCWSKKRVSEFLNVGWRIFSKW